MHKKTPILGVFFILGHKIPVALKWGPWAAFAYIYIYPSKK